MAADEEDCGVGGRLADEIRKLSGFLPERGLLLQEGDGDVVLGRFDGAGVQRGGTAGGGRDANICVGVELVIGVGKLGLSFCKPL